MKKTEWVGIRMPADLYERIVQVARQEDRSLGDMVRIMCRDWLKAHEYKNQRPKMLLRENSKRKGARKKPSK